MSSTKEFACLHLNAHWARMIATGNKPDLSLLPDRFDPGVQFEFRTWHPRDRWNRGELTLPLRDVILTGSDFFLGRDGPEDPSAIAVAAFDIVAVEAGSEPHFSMLDGSVGYDPGVPYVWILDNVRPFSVPMIRSPHRVGAVRGFYWRSLPEDLIEGLDPIQNLDARYIENLGFELRSQLQS